MLYWSRSVFDAFNIAIQEHQFAGNNARQKTIILDPSWV
ncbi:hypothetical protein GLIP_2927 [Aliiglaciecola lipolytica E3]|uniref:Uncharacterized protein n=1 Tax=Aliiglaciecola lipolytica E3 TaxID=1127673 RepID=K6YFY7_9ALTE|nr:hypothetical protein GLIP_2927 [Aliiglaciecola lipolytica E3]